MDTVRQERFPQFFWGMVALGLGLVLAALIGSGAVRSAKRSGDQVEVTGSAKRQVRSDFAVWRLSVALQSPSLTAASTELAARTAEVRAFLAQNGVADSSLTVKPLETEAMYRTSESGGQTSDLQGYRVTQKLEVRSASVAAITTLAQRSGELVTRGVPLVNSTVEYLYTQLEKVRGEMLAAATRDAKSRAEAIATSAGAGVGAVRSARMGVFQITPRNSTEVSDYGINDVTSIDKDITAVVRMTFAVK